MSVQEIVSLVNRLITSPVLTQKLQKIQEMPRGMSKADAHFIRRLAMCLPLAEQGHRPCHIDFIRVMDYKEATATDGRLVVPVGIICFFVIKSNLHSSLIMLIIISSVFSMF